MNQHRHNTPDHSHSLSQTAHKHSIGSHTHSTPNHTHGLTQTAHKHSIGSHAHSMPDHTHSLTQTAHKHSIGGHTHSIPAHTHSLVQTPHKHSIPAHTHDMNHYHSVVATVTIPGQTISVPDHFHKVQIPAHTHSVEIPAHDHNLTLPDHEHAIVYGMFKGPSVSGYVVEVDGKAIPGSVFDAQGTGDIAPYLSVDDNGKIRRGTFHTLAVRPVQTDENPNGLCHIRASWNVQVFISCQTGVQY